MGVFQYEKVKDPTYYGENRVAAHSDHRYYGSVEEMEQHVENFRHSLNGLWKFHYAKNYESTIPGFETPEYDCTKWDDIRVPAHIQMEDMTHRSMPMCSTHGKAEKRSSRARFRSGSIRRLPM